MSTKILVVIEDASLNRSHDHNQMDMIPDRFHNPSDPGTIGGFNSERANMGHNPAV